MTDIVTAIVPATVTDGAVVSSGKTLRISAGSTYTDLSVRRGGIVNVVGGAVSGLTDNGRVNISAGGVVSGGQLAFLPPDPTPTDGSVTVFSGGLAEALTLDGRSYLNIASGGRASGTTVTGTELTGTGTVTVSTGGIANATTVGNDGVLQVNGGKAVGATIGSGGIANVVSNGSATGLSVASGGELDVASGRTTGEIISSGATELLKRGGVSTSATVMSGGTLYLDGGSTTKLTLSSGSIVELFSPIPFVLSSGLAIGALTVYGGTVVVAGGTFETISTNIAEGAEIKVVSGGNIANRDLGDEADIVVSSGGKLVGDTLSGTSTSATILNGGTATGTILGFGTTFADSGSVLTVGSGGIASRTDVLSGGFEVVLNGGKAVGAIVSAHGSDTVSKGGVATSATLLSGAIQTISSGGTAVAAQISRGGVQIVLSGGKATGTIVHSGGTLEIDDGTIIGGTFDTGANIEVGQEAVLTVSKGMHLPNVVVDANGTVVMDGGTIDHLTLKPSGTLAIAPRITASGLKIGGGGRLYVSSGAHVIDPIITSGSIIAIAGGGVAGLNLRAGATAVVSAGGKISGLAINSGSIVVVDSGGVAADLTLRSGALIELDGGKTPNLKTEAGSEVSAEHVSGFTVSSGVRLFVNGESVAQNTTILKGGELVDYYGGGTIDGLTIRSGGTIDFEPLPYFTNAATVSFVEDAGSKQGTLTVDYEGAALKFTLFGQYIAAGFHLKADKGGDLLLAYTPPAAAHVDLAAGPK